MRKILFVFLLPTFIFSQNQLEKDILKVIEDRRAKVGVSVIFENNAVVSINNKEQYPTMSVYKFHIALAVLEKINKEGIDLDSKILVKKSTIQKNTHSPLREKYPTDADFKISIRELIEYMVAKSDNNACDILIKYMGGVYTVNSFFMDRGFSGILISGTEKQMHTKWEWQYLNLTYPYSSVRVMDSFLKGKIITNPQHFKFLKNILISTETGPDKIKGLLPQGIVVGHKTGSSFRNEDGKKAADNDLGFIVLPNGKTVVLGVFVKDSYEDDKTNAQIIAEISKLIYDYHIKE